MVLKSTIPFNSWHFLRTLTGPIVRISPYELHINDTDYYDELYGGSKKFDKYPWAARLFGNSSSAVNTVVSLPYPSSNLSADTNPAP